MRPSRLPLVLALITFVLALASGSYAYNQLLRTVPALVAVIDVPAGGALQESMVRVIRVPAGGVPPRALYGPGQISGRYAAVPLFADQILTQRHVTDRAPAGSPLEGLSQDQRIISVPVKAEAVLGGALRPGDVVDVAAAWPGQEGRPGPVEVLVTGVPVVDLRNAAGESVLAGTEGGGPEGRTPTAVLLLVDSQQARSLVGAAESRATLYLWLVERERS